MPNKKQGLAIHGRHDVLAEYYYGYNEQIKFIKIEKPKSELKTRLRLFKILPKKAGKDLPKPLLKAHQTLTEKYKALIKANEVWLDIAHKTRGVAYKTRDEARVACIVANEVQNEAYKAWPKKDKNAFHRKWCGCKEWNGTEIIF